jgi:hypothetical protein
MNLKTVLAMTVAVAAGGLLAGYGGPAQAADGDFAGSAACQKCHKIEYRSWKQSLHSKMMRKRDEGILKDAAEKWNDGGPAKGNVTGRAAKLDDVEYVVGSHWKQRYLVKNEQTGGWQFMDKQYNRMSGKWEGYGQKNDWDTQCATCHTTGYKVTKLDEATGKVLEASMVEHNVGCEACHGPGAKHVKSEKKADIYGFAGKSYQEQTMICGYCHIRVENEKFMTRQGNPSEHVPHPKVGESFKAGQDDWRKWYPEKLVAPGLDAEDPFNKEYAGDLKGMWVLDEQAKKTGRYEAGKHHQQYQEYLQSTHYTKEKMSCGGCHTSHEVEDKKVKVAAETCKECHKNDGLADADKYMPGTGKTADNLYVRTHSFNKEPRKGGPVATGKAVLKSGK